MRGGVGGKRESHKSGVKAAKVTYSPEITSGLPKAAIKKDGSVNRKEKGMQSAAPQNRLSNKQQD